MITKVKKDLKKFKDNYGRLKYLGKLLKQVKDKKLKAQINDLMDSLRSLETEISEPIIAEKPDLTDIEGFELKQDYKKQPEVRRESIEDASELELGLANVETDNQKEDTGTTYTARGPVTYEAELFHNPLQDATRRFLESQGYENRTLLQQQDSFMGHTQDQVNKYITEQEMLGGLPGQKRFKEESTSVMNLVPDLSETFKTYRPEKELRIGHEGVHKHKPRDDLEDKKYTIKKSKTGW